MSPRPEQEDIAVIGMACMFPGAEDVATYWSNILHGVDAISDPLPAWDAERYLGDGRIATARGGYLRDLYRFNAQEFGIMPRGMDGGEPDQFLALKVARDALADAGYADAGKDHRNTGIILGHSTYLHRGQGNIVQHGLVLDQTLALLGHLFPEVPAERLTAVRRLLAERLPPFNVDIAPGIVPNVMTGRIANRLDLTGPNYLIDAACASSLLAVAAAMNELRTGRSDLMLAGGVNATLPAEVCWVFTLLGALSRTGRVQPFGAEANGTLLGEGLGVVVLKRRRDAERDGDRIYALVKDVGQSSDGRAMGLLAPRLEGEILAIERAYRQSGLDPTTLGLIEAHGTGIPLGDRTEAEALTSVMGGRSQGLPHCAMGSVKSMISHTIPAAGIAGLIKTALALHHRILPPTLCGEVNPELGLDRSPLYVNNRMRPWIHGADHRRRAGVNAFGFGGVNAHAILEEGPPAPAAVAMAWPVELVVMAAADRDGLLARIARVRTYIEQAGAELRLADLAYSLSREPAEGGQRLAVVARDLADLSVKLEQAAGRLADSTRDRVQTRGGLYFSSRPVAGRLAFLFPGEGAQYTDMLADLACAFPVVRDAFDRWDSVFVGVRETLPSQVVFPPPTGLTPEQRKTLEADLYGLELGSEAMFFANQALFELLADFAITPDLVLGHSSGEHSAMLAAGVLDLGEREDLRAHILRLNQIYQHMDAAGDVATGALLTVGAVARERVLELIEAAGGELHLALDNCQHQAVVFGPREATDALAATLRKESGLCSYLPFDRAYHTPLFEPVSRAVEAFYKELPIRPPRLPLVSCAAVAPFPDDPDAIRSLAAGQWSARVRFVETIERLYDEGVRLFVEVGPSGNLTAFVTDILRDREHLALACNNRQKAGLEQLAHLLARLFVNGRRFDPAPLYRRSSLRILDLDQAPTPKRPAALLDNSMPFVSLDAAQIEQIRALLRPAAGEARGAGDTGAAAGPRRVETPAWEGPAAPAAVPLAAAATDEVMVRHLSLMQGFLEQQARILGLELDPIGLPSVHRPAGPSAARAWAAAPARPAPFIDRILAFGDLRAEAELDLAVEAHRFLRHHILYARTISDFDPDLHGLAVVPMAATLEMLVEVAALLRRGRRLTALENVRAYDWIALDAGSKRIRLEATRAEPEGGVIHAAVYDGEARLAECDVVFGDEDPPLPPPLRSLANPSAPVWRDEDLYTTGMFHGSLFHSVAHLVAWDAGGMDAELADTDTGGFFEADGEPPDFWLNPVLLDAVGHLTAFWIAQRIGLDFSCFPSSIRRIAFGDANPSTSTAGASLAGRLGFLQQGRFLEGDYEARGTDGRLLFRIEGWRDRFFSVPTRFAYARTRPREGFYGEDMGAAFPPTDAVVWWLPPFDPGFLEDAGGIWSRLLVHTVLGWEEREAWQCLPAHPRQRRSWLLGRLALKEAARQWLWRQAGTLLCPADLIVAEDELGRPYLTGDWIGTLGLVPEVSLSVWEDLTVAAASGQAVGIALEVLRDPPEGDGAGIEALPAHIATADAHAALAQWPAARRHEGLLRLWCAKVAVAKRAGVDPSELAVSHFDPSGEEAQIAVGGEEVAVSIRAFGDRVIALSR